ncbi:hypothetical protein [Treponema bryantii]|uniref:hypothetical protein n=1 Tax=Treponema bryantii TaxID=163 RepID=UPI0003B6C9DE|nr:hypothetical protein [Treponema bryantii]
MAGRINIKKSAFLIIFASAFLSLCFISCKKNEKLSDVQEEAEKSQKEKKDSDNSFYNPYDDDASWVEPLLARLEEERIAEELARMEESYSEYELENPEVPEEEKSDLTAEEEQPEELNPVEKFFEEAGEGRLYNGKNNQLQFYEFQNEILSPQTRSDGYVIIHSSDQNVLRYFYDFNYHLLKKEDWKIRSAQDSKIERTEEFVYDEETNKVIQKDITTDTAFESVTYNENSSPVLSKKYNIKDEKKNLIQERKWTYNENNKVIEDLQKEYHYKNDDYSKSPELFTKRYEYKYYEIEENKELKSSAAKEGEEGSENLEEENNEKDDIPPDLKYYENDLLKMQYNYTDVKGTYYTWIYFDESLSVKTNYENDVKVSEEFYSGRRLMRKKVYDKVD